MESSSWVCEFCGACFGTREEYRNHKREAHSKGKCTVCDRYVFGTTEEWNSHQESHNRRLSRLGKVPVFPKVKEIDEKVAGKEHSVSKGSARFQCQKCEVSMDFASQEAWNRHAIQCIGLKEKKCGFCGWVTFSQVSLDTHLFRQHYGGQVITRERRRIGNGRVVLEAENEDDEEDDSPSYFDVIELA